MDTTKVRIKYGYNPSLPMVEFDQYAMELILPHHMQKPDRDRSLVMVIGASYQEATSIRQFYERNMPDITPIVIGCNPIRSVMGKDQDLVIPLDYNMTFQACAQDIEVWEKPKKAYGLDSYDLVFIRNPDIITDPEKYDCGNWEKAYRAAFEQLSPYGQVMSIINKNDAENYQKLESKLVQEDVCCRLISGETCLFEDNFLNETYHYLSVLRHG